MFEATSIVEWATALVTISGACGMIVRAITKDVATAQKAQAEKHDDLKHTVKDQAARLDAFEHLRTSDVERIVKVETTISNLKEGQERIERGQDKLAETINDRFDTLADSIREMRVVTPKG